MSKYVDKYEGADFIIIMYKKPVKYRILMPSKRLENLVIRIYNSVFGV